MSWTGHFKIFDDEQVSEFEKIPCESEKSEVARLFTIKSVFNPEGRECLKERRIPSLDRKSLNPETCDKNHIVSFSLFWPTQIDKIWKLERSLETLFREREMGLNEISIWEEYVEPLLREVPRLRIVFPEVIFRVYLADELSFLSTHLSHSGCEVIQMEATSTKDGPNNLWRFLALSDAELVTIANANRVDSIENDILRTQLLQASKLGCWRSPQVLKKGNETISYHPFDNCVFGVRNCRENMLLLLKSFYWQQRSQTKNAILDLVFLTEALYPRLAPMGLMTIVQQSFNSVFLALDIEYVTWANPLSILLILENG